MISALSEFAKKHHLKGFELHVTPETSGRTSIVVRPKLGELTKEQLQDEAVTSLHAALSTNFVIAGTVDEIDETFGESLSKYTDSLHNAAAMYTSNLNEVAEIAREAERKAAEKKSQRGRKAESKPALSNAESKKTEDNSQQGALAL